MGPNEPLRQDRYGLRSRIQRRMRERGELLLRSLSRATQALLAVKHAFAFCDRAHTNEHVYVPARDMHTPTLADRRLRQVLTEAKPQHESLACGQASEQVIEDGRELRGCEACLVDCDLARRRRGRLLRSGAVRSSCRGALWSPGATALGIEATNRLHQRDRGDLLELLELCPPL